LTTLQFRQASSVRASTMLERASRLAEQSDYKYRHAAIIVKNGNVISRGINSKVNDPRQVTNPLTEAGLHAEVAAVKAARNADLNGATIYVARVLKDGSPAMSKPCERCQAFLKSCGIKKVYYTIDSEMDL
jgi:deoxycytidylate deaminase